MPFPLLLAAGVAQGLISAISAAHQRSLANQQIRNNPFPTQSVPQGVLDATKQAELDANTGLPAEQYMQGQQGIDRNTNAALRASLDRHAGVSNIGAIQDAANNSSLKLNVANAQQRIANKVRFLSQKNTLGQFQNQVWDWNNRQRYLQNAAAARALLGASRQGFNNAADSVLSGAIMQGQNGGFDFGSGSKTLSGGGGALGMQNGDYDAWKKQYDNVHETDPPIQ